MQHLVYFGCFDFIVWTVYHTRLHKILSVCHCIAEISVLLPLSSFADHYLWLELHVLLQKLTCHPLASVRVIAVTAGIRFTVSWVTWRQLKLWRKRPKSKVTCNEVGLCIFIGLTRLNAYTSWCVCVFGGVMNRILISIYPERSLTSARKFGFLATV